jgi:hypothetical protein
MVRRGRKGLLVLRALKGLKGRKGLLVPLALKALRARRVRMVRRGLKDRLVLRVLKGRKALQARASLPSYGAIAMPGKFRCPRCTPRTAPQPCRV